MEAGDNLSCDETIGGIVENCPLLQFWGDSLFNELVNTNSGFCVSWSGDCNLIHEISDQDVAFAVDLENGCVDCNGNPCEDKLPWIGDGTCDEGDDANFSCPEFACDMEDCGLYSATQSGCYCQRDCFGNCFNNIDCFIYYGHYGYDCCADDGTCEDLTGDGFIQSGLGDGWCDDGSRGYGFNCQEVDGFNFNCDGGDCGIWNPETGQCEPAPGEVIRYFDDEFYPESYE
jgi:hypothetical protein